MLLGVLSILQRRLEAFYALEGAPSVRDFVSIAGAEEREVLLLKEGGDVVELRLVVPLCAPGEMLVPSKLADRYLQVLEGVSHFVFVTERIRRGLPTTQLELELQAEVDKLVLLDQPLSLRQRDLAQLHARLYGGARFLHAPESELGQRYRLAHSLAARFTRRVFTLTGEERRRVLMRFYQSGPGEKLSMAQAA